MAELLAELVVELVEELIKSESNYIFLDRYSVGESSMIVGLFFFRPIVKILIYRFKT